MNRTIPNYLRLLVAERAGHRCEYCHVPEFFMAIVFHIDHVRSLKHKGKTVLNNLAFCCPHCNQNKGSDVATFIDDSTTDVVRFFNPRTDHWNEHFYFKPTGEIWGLTKIGKATAEILDFNLPERVALRQGLIEIGRIS